MNLEKGLLERAGPEELPDGAEHLFPLYVSNVVRRAIDKTAIVSAQPILAGLYARPDRRCLS